MRRDRAPALGRLPAHHQPPAFDKTQPMFGTGHLSLGWIVMDISVSDLRVGFSQPHSRSQDPYDIFNVRGLGFSSPTQPPLDHPYIVESRPCSRSPRWEPSIALPTIRGTSENTLFLGILKLGGCPTLRRTTLLEGRACQLLTPALLSRGVVLLIGPPLPGEILPGIASRED